MKFILVLFCIFCVVFSSPPRPPRETKVIIDVNGSPGRRAGVIVHTSGQGGVGSIGNTNVFVSHGDHRENQGRSEVRVSSAGHSGTSGSFHGSTQIRGASGTGAHGRIVAYGSGPRHISANIKY